MVILSKMCCVLEPHDSEPGYTIEKNIVSAIFHFVAMKCFMSFNNLYNFTTETYLPEVNSFLYELFFINMDTRIIYLSTSCIIGSIDMFSILEYIYRNMQSHCSDLFSWHLVLAQFYAFLSYPIQNH